MTDALSEIARDKQRAEYFEKFVRAALEYIQKPARRNLKASLKAAGETDSVVGGYWSKAATNLLEGLENRLRKLSKGDKEEWARFLWLVQDELNFKEIKALSPFKNQLTIFVDYGHGFVHNRVAGLQDALNRIIREKYGWTIYDCDKYVVVLPNLSTEKIEGEAEVFWISCGIRGVSGPRTVDKKK